MQRASVDLPDPDWPTIASVSPLRTLNDASLTAWTGRRFSHPLREA